MIDTEARNENVRLKFGALTSNQMRTVAEGRSGLSAHRRTWFLRVAATLDQEGFRTILDIPDEKFGVLTAE